jgi:hypothetical protein
MRPDKRLMKVALALAARGRADQFQIIEAVPVDRENALGHPPGLYRSGPEGSSVGLLVYDPAAGEPVVPKGRLAPHGLVIVLGPEYVEPPDTEPTPLEPLET